MMFFFFFNDTATTEIYTLSLHDALPIFEQRGGMGVVLEAVLEDDGGDADGVEPAGDGVALLFDGDRKSTRLNSSHSQISYAVFCLKKKKKDKQYIFIYCYKLLLSLFQQY